ncbi:DNA-binding protein [Solimonas flava]|uniref:DNA-binding protein n=1 Tax=Solimonas flava TaxID=415849 RepID=UPI0004186F7A|nr:DNA-binding protein [Solimonas flava]
MRTGVTLADITRAADQLLAEGERPTIEGVRKILGTGSPATVNALLKQYFQTLPARLHLPASIATAAAELYERIQATALETVGEERAALDRQVALEREQLAQDRRAFESEKTELRAVAASLRADVERLQELQRQQSSKIATLEKELAGHSARAATAEAQARAGEEERERFAQRHAAEIQRLREQSEGNERHLLVRIDEHKTQQQRLQADRERDVGAASKRISDLEAALSEALKLQASLRADLAAAQRETTKRNEAIAARETAIKRAQEDAVKEVAANREAQEGLKSQIATLERNAEQLQRERDGAIREAARLEGRLGIVQAQLKESKAELVRLHRGKPKAAESR